MLGKDRLWLFSREVFAAHARGAREAFAVHARGAREVFAVHAPLSMTPRLPVERRMIIAGRGDRVCPPAHVRRLWEHWDQPEMVWFDGGHIVRFGRRRMLATLRRFLRERRSDPR